MLRPFLIAILILICFQSFSQNEIYTCYLTRWNVENEMYYLLNNHEDTVATYIRHSWKETEFETDFGNFYIYKKKKKIILSDSGATDTFAVLTKKKILSDLKEKKEYRMLGTLNSFLFFDQNNKRLFESRVIYSYEGYKIEIETQFDHFDEAAILISWYKILNSVPLDKDSYYPDTWERKGE